MEKYSESYPVESYPVTDSYDSYLRLYESKHPDFLRIEFDRAYQELLNYENIHSNQAIETAIKINALDCLLSIHKRDVLAS